LALLAYKYEKNRSAKMGKAREELYNKRSAIEAKISEAKKMHGLKTLTTKITKEIRCGQPL